MLDRQRVTTLGISTTAAAALAAAILLQPWKSTPTEHCDYPAPNPNRMQHGDPNGHAVDVVFAVDTTGSMGSLIDGARRTVWSIATHIKQVDPQADVRIGLVAYRDVQDEYITRDFALTRDMDAAFAELSGYVANGGNDFPEDVDAGLFDAVHKMDWRPDAKKLIFLVGDAPPATRGDVPAYDVTARQAAEMGISINTIRCGVDPDTQTKWQQIAELTHGEYSSIVEDGGVKVIATPFDDQIATLSNAVDGTTVIYGSAADHEAYRVKMGAAAAAPAPAKADRADWYSKNKGARASGDVIEQVQTGSLSVDALDPAMLPDDMQAMSKDQVKQELDKRAETRAQAQKQIDELTRQRAEYLRAHADEGGAGGFDKAVETTLEKQLK